MLIRVDGVEVGCLTLAHVKHVTHPTEDWRIAHDKFMRQTIAIKSVFEGKVPLDCLDLS